MASKYEALLEAGLSTNEAKVYLAALSMGASNANTIARAAGVHRVNTYDILERLQGKGLLAQEASKGKRMYRAATPHKLITLLEEKQQMLSGVMPSLLADFKEHREEQEVMVFKGPEGVMTAYKMMLEERKTLYALGGQGLNRQYLRHRHFRFEEERQKKGIQVYALYYESARGMKQHAEGWHIRYLPDAYRSAIMIDICGDLVITLLSAPEITATVINNPTLADGYRKLFDLLWQNANA